MVTMRLADLIEPGIPGATLQTLTADQASS